MYPGPRAPRASATREDALLTTPASSVRLRRLVDAAVHPLFETLFAMLDLAGARLAGCACDDCAAASCALITTVQDRLARVPEGSPGRPWEDRA